MKSQTAFSIDVNLLQKLSELEINKSKLIENLLLRYFAEQEALKPTMLKAWKEKYPNTIHKHQSLSEPIIEQTLWFPYTFIIKNIFIVINVYIPFIYNLTY